MPPSPSLKAVRAETWQDERRAMTEALRAARRTQPLVERLARALGALASLSQVAAVHRSAEPAITPDERNPTGKRPPGQDDPELRFAYERVERAIEALELALDGERGYAPGRSPRARLAEEKDYELFTEWAGTPAVRIPRDAGLGSVATIYRKRKLAGFCTMGLLDGEKPEPVVARERARVINDRDLLVKDFEQQAERRAA